MSERDEDSIPFPGDDELGAEPELDEASERALGEALRSAWAPAPIDPRRHAELLEQALIDPFAPASEEEARESERLRQALETGDESHADVRLLRALAAADRPLPLSPEASAKAGAEPERAKRSSGTNVVYVTFGVAVLAAAAAFTLVVGGGFGAAPAAKAERLVPSRSTTDLFEHEFAQGETTDRIDRIASSRAHDLRENRYLMWGAR
ncbi:MAG TPA: hypothetical protein VF103_16330 [Polyangiaceae bacterium]